MDHRNEHDFEESDDESPVMSDAKWVALWEIRKQPTTGTKIPFTHVGDILTKLEFAFRYAQHDELNVSLDYVHETSLDRYAQSMQDLVSIDASTKEFNMNAVYELCIHLSLGGSLEESPIRDELKGTVNIDQVIFFAELYVMTLQSVCKQNGLELVHTV